MIRPVPSQPSGPAVELVLRFPGAADVRYFVPLLRRKDGQTEALDPIARVDLARGVARDAAERYEVLALARRR